MWGCSPARISGLVTQVAPGLGWVRCTAQPPWVADSALIHSHSTSHDVEQMIITYRRLPRTTDSAMTFMLHVPSQPLLKARVYLSVV